MSRECGFALITVVLLMIGLAVLATGLLFAATQQATVSATLVDLARARHGAEAAVAIAVEGWSSTHRSLDAPGGIVEVLPATDLEAGVRIAATAERIGPRVFVVAGTATATRGALPPIRRTAERIVRSLDVDELGRSLDAAIVTNRAVVGAAASASGGDSAAVAPQDPSSLCARWPSRGSAVRASPDSVHVADVTTLTGMPPMIPDEDPLRVLDLLDSPDPAALRGLALSAGPPAVTPAAVERGMACDTAPSGNWGAAAGACAAHYVLRHAPADLSVTGGYGQGILLVDGDLVLDGGFTFRGIIIVEGTVTVRDASVRGVIVAGSAELEGGVITLDRCAIAEALASVAATRTAYPPARSWVPTFD